MFNNLDDIPIINSIDIESQEPMTTQRFWLHLTSDGIGAPIYIPVIIIRGKSDKNIVGVTAVVHGNELNGISIIQKLVQNIDPQKFDGVLVCVPVSNVPSFLQRERLFPDGSDLNQIMPGGRQGDESNVYAYRFVSRLINELDYLIDLHTASFGNENSFFVNANMEIAEVSHMAWLQNPQFIVDRKSSGSLRQAAEDLGVHAITVEVGDPHRFQNQAITTGFEGIINMLVCFNMLEGEVQEADETIVECSRAYWLHTDRGGLLEVYPQLAEQVEEGQPIAKVSNIFGDIIKEYIAPEKGVVIGRNTHPVNRSGGRILHLGIFG
ncbi:MAG: succinylglutamate desuccinylase/aspartoacylase family protein [Anaerolineae bacterium]